MGRIRNILLKCLPAVAVLCAIVVILGCETGFLDKVVDLNKEPPVAPPRVTEFSFISPPAIGTITEATHTIAVTVPFGTAVTALVPTITHTGASISPASGVARDFTSPVTYTVTAADATTQAYTVTVTVASNSAKAITAFNFASPAATGTITEATHTIAITVPFGTAVTALVPTITHTGASISPVSGVAQNFTSPVTYTVTAADATTQAYTVTVTVAPPSDYTSANIGTLKYVPAGTFQRDATATNTSTVSAFRMSEKEITRAQFVAVTGLADPSDETYSTGLTNPVQVVSWYTALVFCNKLSNADGLTPVYTINGTANPALWGAVPTTNNAMWNAATVSWSATGYRLPTEMEWMWAAMGATGGTTGYLKTFAGSTGSNAIGNYAWTGENSTDTTHPVGTKLTNELGLYDMSGNVVELCWDWYGTYPTGAQTDYRGAASGTYRVKYGGGWLLDASYATLAFRGADYPYYTFIDVGFRVVRP